MQARCGQPLWRRMFVLVAYVGLLAGVVTGCAGSTDGELKAEVEQLNQDLQQSVGELNEGIAESLSELQAAIADAAQPGTGAWEYNLGVVVYDVECAARAIGPYENNSTVREHLSSVGGPSRLLIGWLYMEFEYTGNLAGEDWVAIGEAYTQCGQEAFQLYSTSMGDEGWEMVSYSRLQHTLPAVDQYDGGVVVDYGYEVMWKRPRASQ